MATIEGRREATNRRSLRALLADWQAAVAGTSLPQPPRYHEPDVALSGLVEHTDEVRPGACFVARVRATSDGHQYIGEALAKGASLILGQNNVSDLGIRFPEGVPYLRVRDTAVATAWLAAAWEGFPGRQLVMVGITGTDGKTTTANLLYEVLKGAGLKVGLISTIRAIVGTIEEPLAFHVTTPEAPVVQRFLRRMVDRGLSHCVLETTSHGLAQSRVDAIDFDLAIVTNITHEHLDYHGDYESYLAAKSRLFEALMAGDWRNSIENPYKRGLAKTAILNAEDASYARLAQIPVPRRLTYAIGGKADISATDIDYAADATHFNLNFPRPPGSAVTVSTPFVGDFNVQNMLAAAAAAYALGITPKTMKQGLETLQSLSGRMERIDAGQPFLTIVDFAHTPNALSRVIAAARRMVEGKIITVFGSAGKRYVEKRRLMAQISARDADLTVLTAEDPRTESLDDILDMMADGCRSQGGVEDETFWRVRDRGEAIYHALTLAQPTDLVLVCGKGHEQSMCFGTVEHPWDDREATRAALRAFLQSKPMPDLGLPTFSGRQPQTVH